ncbi:FISUMP domain-containing protein [Mucilaginibacter sp.]|uniref:FISUMP domain-containing protein n=1 Tax=Mucilaginibacter sp. TaxID=1882438 RepID=UPI002634CCFE|nr:FISUMP domain-containing protein [Mucilaginibacter sp.]MDB4923770.1 hypothetical protein [Mucilaginibacter sp.]
MKRKYTSLLSVLLLLTTFALVSCSKKNSDNTPVEDKNSVKINGVTYPTVTIGSQIWTSVNYKGPGGYNLPATEAYGNFYNHSEADLISLPTGWRVPSVKDFSKLLSNFSKNPPDFNGNYYLNGSNDASELCVSSGWGGILTGTNTSGFSVINAGFYEMLRGEKIRDNSMSSRFLTSDTPKSATEGLYIYNIEISPESAQLEQILNTYDADNLYISVRFVKDK